jgi:hypothetical protein
MATTQRSTWPTWARALTTGWVLSPIIVIAMVAATFEGYGFYTRHQKTTYSRGGAFGATDAQSSPLHSAKRAAHHGPKSAAKPAAKGHTGQVKNGGTTVTTLGTGASPKHSAHHASSEGSSTGGSVSDPTHSSSPTPVTSTSTSTSPSSTDALVTPRSGVYTLAVSGQESAKFGPISACHNTFPSRSTLDVHHASGESASSYDFDLRMYPNQANRHDERHIYQYSTRSVILTYEQETVTCSGIKQSSVVDYSPAQTRVELPLAVGKSWRNHGGGSSRTETGTSSVVKRSSLKIEGKSYQVYEIVTKLKLTGSETGERDQTWWYSPQLAMPLKFGETLHGNRSGAKYSESYNASVIGIP